MSHRRAMTIAEILVVCGVFGLILGLLVQAVALAFRTQSRTVEHTQSYRNALLVAARLERELTTCHHFINPTPLMSGVLTPLVGLPLQFERNDETTATGPTETGVKVTYYYNPTRREIIRDDSRNNHPKSVVQGVQSFTVDAQARYVDIVMQIDYAPDPIRFRSTPCKM